jgi:hypothetical protein
VVFPAVPALAERLARAGFAVVSVGSDAPDALATVVAALRDGKLGFRATAIGLIGSATADVATPLGLPWYALADGPDAGDAAVRWCAQLAC